MYDPSEGARRRINLRTKGAGILGRRYRELADMLMTAPDSALRGTALKQLADSCDNAITLMENTRQSKNNQQHIRRSPGQSNG